MSSKSRSIVTLLIGSALLYLGYGLLATLLPLRGQLEGFSTTVIGFMGTAYFAGFAVGCLIGPKAVKQVGHIRCFTAFAALAAAATLAHPLLVDPYSWCLLRAMVGVCLAILYMVIESWLNEEASNVVRGRVLSLYIIVGNLVTIGGQLMVNLYDPRQAALFSIAAMLVALSLVPLALTTAAAPKPVAWTKLDLRGLFRLSPAGFVGCLLIGLVDGAFWSLGPIFAQGRGMTISEVTLFMSAFVVGGTLSQWPIGRLSDKLDRRLVIAACCLAGVGTALAITMNEADSFAVRMGLAVLHGAVVLPLYPLCLAHANDFAPNDALVPTSSGLLLVYGAGAVVGPLLVASVMDRYGVSVLFLIIAVLLAALALYCLYRVLQRPLLAALERVVFVPVPKTTPSLYALETDEDWEPEDDEDAGPSGPAA